MTIGRRLAVTIDRADWALVLALIVLLAVALLAIAQAVRSSSRGQLRQALKVLGQKRRTLRRAAAQAAALQGEVERLEQRAGRVKPRHLEEARGRVADARALAKIAHDQVLIAENHVRRIIVQEFAPAKQARLRARYRVDEQPDKRPFTF